VRGDPDVQGQAFDVGAGPGMGKQLGHVVAARDVREAASSGQRRVASSAGDIEHTLAGVHLQLADE
jgi:hypothetical protein